VPVSLSGRRRRIDGQPFKALRDLKAGADTVVINVASYRMMPHFATGQVEILLRNVDRLRSLEFCVARIGEVRSASSIAVYHGDTGNFDDARPGPYRDPHPGELMYGWSKRITRLRRLFAAKSGISTVAFRLTNLTGRSTRGRKQAHVLPAFVIRALTSTGDFAVAGSRFLSRLHLCQRRCEIFRRSLAWRGAAKPTIWAAGKYFRAHLAESILHLTGTPRPIVCRARPPRGRPSHCRNDRLKADFDFRTLRPGRRIEATIAWYRDVSE